MSNDDPAAATEIVFSEAVISVEDIVAISRREVRVTLDDSSAFEARIQAGADLVDQILAEDGVIYGVTTGYGDSCDVAIPTELIAELPRQLYTYHGCGLGSYFDQVQTRAITAARLTSLCKGWSGVSLQLLNALVALLQADILPVMPSEGSVGASGDLTPLSYLAAVLCGEREVWGNGAHVPAGAALSAVDISPVILRPKEGLAIMNGTAAMTGLACLAYSRAAYLGRLSARITAFSAFAIDANIEHFDARLFSAKPHAGMQQVASWVRTDLRGMSATHVRNSNRLQDRYSIRCAPHVIGVLIDALPWMKRDIENELNSANDNPLVDVESGRILHGGHFYGGHIAFAMDSMKNAVANLADLLDRQMALLVDSRYNNGLPANLSGAEGARKAISHGLKALQISVSAWTAEALKLTMPASVFSRSTECHNQDKVSMGTIAARDCLRVLELVEQVAAALLVTVRQAVELRIMAGSALPIGSCATMYQELRAVIPFLGRDRRLDRELRQLVIDIQDRTWAMHVD
ncbi:MAG: aromatic amino acid ammonia-lyase [Burkholderiaceae bacterium]